MSSLFDLLAEVDRDLRDCQSRWALVGGLAVGARTEPRFTRDLDLVVAVENDSVAEQLVLSLRKKGYEISAVIEQARTGRLATVRLLPRADGRLVDLLFASSGIELDVVDAAELLELSPSLTAPVANVGHLIAMKVLSRDDQRRPQDRMDLAALLGVASKADLELAHTAIRKIIACDCHRGRPLADELGQVIAEFDRHRI